MPFDFGAYYRATRTHEVLVEGQGQRPMNLSLKNTGYHEKREHIFPLKTTCKS